MARARAIKWYGTTPWLLETWWWWTQAAIQATDALPVLLYRLDRDQWRAVWPVAALLVAPTGNRWAGYDWTVEGSVAAWAAVAREVM